MDHTGLVSLLRRTYWISVAAIAAVGITVVAVAIAQRNKERWTQHSRDVVRIARRAQIFALDRETGVRGFLLTGDSATLAPYRDAEAPLRAALDSLIASTSDNPAQQRRAAAFAAAIARWDSTFARPALSQRFDGTGGVGTAFGTAGLAGKVLFDDIRTRYAEFESEEESLYQSRSKASVALQLLNVVVAIVGLILLGGVQASLRRRVSTQANALLERQTQLEDQAVELEEQASELEEQATELEAQTEELQHTVRELGRKNEELDAFSASVAHDLRSPLRSIDGFSHLLISDYSLKLDEGGISALKRIRANAQRMGELIDGLLSLARVSAVELRRTDVDLSCVASRVVEDLRRGANGDSNAQLEVQPGLAARGDARLLRIVVNNLIDNAFKFTRSRPSPRVEVGTRDVDGERAFYVEDNGIGFDMSYAGKLFGAFERLHDDPGYEGTGIGLATVRRIVERHGGRIWAEAEAGRGATFYFTLPG
jgi:signal transduction histidine kinase